jgi:hypothetical protein
MRVLLQDWDLYEKGIAYSISKDKKQLEATKKRIVDKGEGKPNGKPTEVTIPDDHAFAEMVETRTVFLQHDEMDVIKY